jgi:HSP20 family protein
MLDRVFDDVMRSALGNGYATTAALKPAVDVVERENEFVFHLDVPGVRREDLELTLENRVLSIKGSRKYEAHENEKVSLGRSYGAFALSYTLPEHINSEQLAADLADGVLTIRVPKHEKAQPRRIQIADSSASNQLNK